MGEKKQPKPGDPAEIAERLKRSNRELDEDRPSTAPPEPEKKPSIFKRLKGGGATAVSMVALAGMTELSAELSSREHVATNAGYEVSDETKFLEKGVSSETVARQDITDVPILPLGLAGVHVELDMQ